MSWLIVGISAFQQTSRIGKCPRRPRNRRFPPGERAEKARHDSGESRCVKPVRSTVGARVCASRPGPRIFAAALGADPAKSRLTLLDCVGIGVNGIIGSGIFLLPARVFAHAGGLAWASWF